MLDKIYKILKVMTLILFGITPFLMSVEQSDSTELLSAAVLPPNVVEIASFLRWVILGVFCVVSAILLQSKYYQLKITKPVILITCFYFAQFVYALIDNLDYERFLIMTLMSFFIPPLLSNVLLLNKKITINFVYLITFFLLVSFALNGKLILENQRFFGFMNNPNIFGISTVFWMTILLICDRYHNLNKYLFYVLFTVIILAMIFTGSRNAIVGMFIIIGFNYSSKILQLLKGLLLITTLLYIGSHFIDVSFLTDRFTNISHSSTESGRSEIWESARFAIQNNFFTGNGMDANYRISNTGNMHNIYVRFLLNMGLIFTLISLAFYFTSIFSAARKKKVVPIVAIAYLISYAFMNIGEDFFVGLGSSTFVYLLFVYAYINYKIVENDTTKKNIIPI